MELLPNLLRVNGESAELGIFYILCSRTDVSFYSAAEEVAGDSGVQGRESSRVNKNSLKRLAAYR